jgi:hypothetical protein
LAEGHSIFHENEGQSEEGMGRSKESHAFIFSYSAEAEASKGKAEKKMQKRKVFLHDSTLDDTDSNAMKLDPVSLPLTTFTV